MSGDREKIREMQALEQTIQNLSLQKQAFEMELSETRSALSEVEKSEGETFKMIGQLMIRAEKEKTVRELSEKERILGMRIKAMEKQEISHSAKLDGIRSEFMKRRRGPAGA